MMVKITTCTWEYQVKSTALPQTDYQGYQGCRELAKLIRSIDPIPSSLSAPLVIVRSRFLRRETFEKFVESNEGEGEATGGLSKEG